MARIINNPRIVLGGYLLTIAQINFLTFVFSLFLFCEFLLFVHALILSDFPVVRKRTLTRAFFVVI